MERERAEPDRMISIRDAAEQKISRLRSPQWSDQRDHIELYLMDDGGIGPWVKVWSESNVICGFASPQKLLSTEFDCSKKEWQAYAP